MDAIDEELIVKMDKGTIRSSMLSKRLGLPASTTHFRIKRLEKEGIIKGYKGEIDWKKAGFPLEAFIFVNIDVDLLKSIKKTQDRLLKELLAIMYVREGYIITGDSDILIRVMARDTEHLKEILLNSIDAKEGVVKTHTTIILSN
ncbi:MAG: Lrp/AsnC family transcriptional regulator [Candidatus Micrarchaeota archaeon]|nr:Lrp/AsnC family transcriptional regulator [Candidatus Micrarchaeota archaeon]MDE1859218.1 Lrp/AsnC family transcriptional regulator [Candidatus Micrarchaeota archaeon]